ncbi:uncharacterized protein LOC122867990 [Siniperca chuatsi]|uniref:uncharacterized protein LOC122867990 n=1 Tax=Siniperca chuatsi TaxID=119488 RepID=UPI001CE1AD93|nr:uncharacterized protein LOC122867990 [Siniperca chuatsi]
MWHREYFPLVTEAMGAVRVLFIYVLTVWLAKGSCLPVGGANERHDNGLQRRMRDLSPNEISIKKALVLVQSMESMLQQDAKEVQLESNEVEAKASIGHKKFVQFLNSPKDIKTEKDDNLHSDNVTAAAADNVTASDNVTAAAADNVTASDNVTAAAADNVTASDNVTAAAADNVTASDNVTAARRRQRDGQRQRVTAAAADKRDGQRQRDCSRRPTTRDGQRQRDCSRRRRVTASDNA